MFLAMTAWALTTSGAEPLRLTIWEDAMLGGLVRYEGSDRKAIALTPEGRAVIEGRRGLADAAE